MNEGRIFTPFYDEPVLWKPLAAISWPPSSYDPDTNLMYICATDGSWGGAMDPDYSVVPDYVYAGGITYPSNLPRRGLFAALDLTTNRIAWRRQWADPCYSGSLTTAGGLVFVGRNDGRLTALDSSNGDRLWAFQTDGGVNAPAISFERNGEQFVLVYAGGTSLVNSKRSDGLWLFSLNGTIDSLPRGSADPSRQRLTRVPTAGGDRARSAFAFTPTRAPDIENGRTLYTTACITCHGVDGLGGSHGGAALTPALDMGAAISTLTTGRGDMPAFGGLMSQDEIQDVAAYLINDLIPTAAAE